MPILQLRLLGHFQLLVDGKPAPIKQARLQSLLAYLVLHRNSPRARQHLAFLFWPDSTEAQARANLRKALYDLHHAIPELDAFLQLGQERPKPEADASVELDVTSFEESLGQALAAGRSSAAQNALEHAVALYAGDLLPACYDEWILPERERLHQCYLGALQQLILLLEEQRQYLPAIAYTQRLLQVDPLYETAYVLLMRLHSYDGNRAQALRAYHTCATVLQQEFGVEPGPETQAAYRHLLHLETSPSPAPEAQAWPLVGRQHEWEALQNAWRAAARSEPQMALIAGEAGIGKTRLAEEVLQWAERQGYATARTRSYAAEGQLAYAPIADWLRVDRIRTRFVNLDRMWLSEVARLLPELLIERPELPIPHPLTDSWQRQRFREALARAFLTNEQPLLLLLDDLQWCDQETLEWLHYLLRFSPKAQLLVVGTVRTEEVGADHPLHALAMNLRQGGKLLEVELEALDAAETATLAALAAGRELDAGESVALYAATEGHPLFVIETMRAGDARSNAPLPAPSIATGLPPKVQAVIGARLGQLTPATRELAELAAVVGRAFTVEVLAQAGTGNEDALVQGLDELWQRRMIREQGANAYDFSHDKIREVAYGGVTPPRRRLLHRQVAQALEKLYAVDLDPVSAQIATQYEHAGMAGEAVAYYERAASVAQRIYAHGETAGYLTRALTLLKGLQEKPQRAQQELNLLIALGVSLTVTKGWSDPEVERVYEQARALCVQIGNAPQLSSVLWGLHNFYRVQGDVGRAYDLGRQALGVAFSDGDPVPQVAGYFMVGGSLFHRGELGAARELLELGIALYNPRQHTTYLALYGLDFGVFSYSYLAHILWYLGYPDLALERGQAALVLAREVSHPFSLALALGYTAMLAQFRRDVEATVALAKDALALCMEHQFPYYLEWATVLQGWAFSQQGDLARGSGLLQRGLTKLRAMGTGLREPYYLMLLAEVQGQAGNREIGLHLLAAALTCAHTHDERCHEAELHRVEGELLCHQQTDEETCEAAFRQALEIARRQEAKSLELRAAMSLARLWQRQGKRQAACDLLAEVYNWFSEGFDTPDLRDARALLAELTEA